MRTALLRLLRGLLCAHIIGFAVSSSYAQACGQPVELRKETVVNCSAGSGWFGSSRAMSELKTARADPYPHPRNV
jgi:hypothetical protein